MYVGPKSLLLIVCVVFIFHGNFGRSEEQYCDIESCSSGEHTMCRYPNSGPAPNCNGYKKYRLSSEDETLILFTHNALRNQVASGGARDKNFDIMPSATNMRKMDWNSTLAKIAQRWADQCLDGQDACRNLPGLSVGQNIGTSCDEYAWDDARFSIVEELWSRELERSFNRSDIENYQYNPKTSNVTQMIWASTTQVGCGAVGKMPCVKLVCNYGPAGNQIGRNIYERGKPASACPNGRVDRRRTLKNLCM